ncbi:MAG: hypothetical protein ACFFA3_01050 [Promethearchaeota archaeon]
MANAELNNLKKNVDTANSESKELKENNVKLVADLNARFEEVKALKLKIADAENKVSQYEEYKNQATIKNNELESKINDLKAKNSEKEKEIESLKKDLDILKSETESKLTSLRNELSENKSNKQNLEKKIEDNEGIILELKKRNKELETQILQAINIPKLLKEVKEVLQHKGFISEMEFENIMKRL